MRTRVLFVLGALAIASPTFAQSPSAGATMTPATRGVGVWIDVNFVALNSSQKEQTYTFERTLFSQTARGTTAYPALPVVYGLGVSGGYQLGNGLGFGVQYTGAEYASYVGMTIQIPSPWFYNTYASDAAPTGETLARTDKAFDLSATYTFSTPDAWRIRVFGGPTYFTVSQEMVHHISYEQFAGSFFPTNVVDITTYNTETVTGSSWGGHVGADVAYFFSRHVGVGGVFRVNGGSVTIDEPFSEDTATLKVGFVTTGAGLRIRF